MYPDQLSLNEGFLGEIFDKYGLAISPMGKTKLHYCPYKTWRTRKCVV